MIKIKNWKTGEVIFSADVEMIKTAVELAVTQKVSLAYADLRSADLTSANLHGGCFYRSYLIASDISEANCEDSDFSDACMAEANISGANFKNSNLSLSLLCGANCNNTDFSGANLHGVDFFNAFIDNAILDKNNG